MEMKLLLTAWAFSGLGACATAVEKTANIPEGWKMLDNVPDASAPVRLSIAMRQPEIHGLASSILSNTALSLEKIVSLRTPAENDVKDVMTWLSDNGITDAKLDQDWIQVQTTVSKADKLLDTQLRNYSFNGKRAVLRTTEYSVPDDLAKAITFIHPIANFMTPEHEVSKSTDLTSDNKIDRRDLACSPVTTPDCLKKLYGIDYAPPDGKSTIRLGIAGFLEEWANFQDTETAFQNTLPELVKNGYNFTVESVNGGQNDQSPGKAGIEANLDIQFGMAVAYPLNVVFYTTGGRGVKLDDNNKPIEGEDDDNEPYLELIEYLLQKPDDQLPQVLSVSYADDEFSVPKPYAYKVCDLLGMLAGRGVSIISGSGDGGARGGRNATCRANTGDHKEMTISTFPASCPWVTSVGAVTNFDDPPRGAQFSSGGFSDFFEVPTWQKDAAAGYVKALDGHLDGYYNPHMRAVPDISAVGTRFNTIVNGVPIKLQGTSASTPVVAAMIALINDARVRKGKKVLGFLNDKLYSNTVKSVLQDITDGESVSCVFDGKTPGGWPAKPGYDTITGLGVPNNFQKFMDALVNA